MTDKQSEDNVRGPILWCWCGERGYADELFDFDALRERCGGSGVLYCYCGETPCPGCEDCEPERPDSQDPDDYPEGGLMVTELSIGVCEACHQEAPLVNGLCAACRPAADVSPDPRTLPGDEARLLYLTVRHNANERHPAIACPEGMAPGRYHVLVASWLARGWACRCNLLPVLTISGRLAARQLTQVDLHAKGTCLPGCELCPRAAGPGKGG